MRQATLDHAKAGSASPQEVQLAQNDQQSDKMQKLAGGALDSLRGFASIQKGL